MIPLRTDVPLRSTPWANYLLIAINVVVFFVQRWSFDGELHTPGALDPRDPRLIHYFTYQFLHGSAMHLAGNMLFLYIFGNNVADRIGNVGYLAFYLAGGVAAGIGHLAASGRLYDATLTAAIWATIGLHAVAQLAGVMLSRRALADARCGRLLGDLGAALAFEISLTAARIRATASAVAGRRSAFVRTEKRGA